MRAGADVNKPDRHGVTPMQEAMRNRYKALVYRDIIKLLEQHGGRKEADINTYAHLFLAFFLSSLFFCSLSSLLLCVCEANGVF